MLKKILSFVFLLGYIFTAMAFPVKLSYDTTASIGDHIELKASVTLPDNNSKVISYPNVSDTTDKRIVFFPELFHYDTLFNEKTKEYTFEKTFVFSIYEEGSFEIPSLIFAGASSLLDTFPSLWESGKAQFIISAPKIDTTTAFKDIKTVFSIPYTFKEIFPWIFGSILLLVLVYLTYRYFKNRKKAEPLFTPKAKPILPPAELALQKLRLLYEKKLWQQGLVKEYYTELTDIIRFYLEAECSVGAMEKTTDEILEAYSDTNPEKRNYVLLERILRPAIIVKFAKGIPSAELHESVYKDALEFVQSTCSQSTNS